MPDGFAQIVHIQDDIIRLHGLGVLEPLLADKTTGGNILWATDAYAERGPRYEPAAEIMSDLIAGEENIGIIRTRARKDFEQQSARTRRRAEVYTPLWVCRMMCDHLDAVWFRRKDGFNRVDPATGRVRFLKNRTWTAYVKSTRMEITCGEGPFLTSRYDAPTGTLVPVRERVGLLDRKLRAVSENTDNEADWLKWAARAFQSSYGYEFQGDSLLIARINALMTFAECFHDRWGHFPSADKCKVIADIIAWNLWQMDGLTDAIPYRTLEKYPQMVISGWAVSQVSMLETPKGCHIYDWQKGCDVEYLSLKEKGADAMKFDFIIGNPPYQEETSGDNDAYAPSIYHHFLDACYEVSDRVELIHPARFLFNAGNTPKAWNEKMLSDPHLKVVFYEQNSGKIFPNTSITAGIVVTYHDKNRDFGKIETFTSFQELNAILQKAAPKTEESSLMNIVYNQMRFNLNALYKEYPDLSSVIGSDGRDKRFRNNIFDKIPLFTVEPVSDDDIHVLGVVNSKREWRYFPKRFIDGEHENLWKYKAMLSSANGASGTLGEDSARIITVPFMAEPGVGYTQTFIGVGAFDTEDEASACVKYIKTKFARVMLGTLKVTQHNPPEKWRYVPIQDFTPDSDIDWSKSIPEIDRQLYAKYRLDEKEIAFIESHVKEMT